MQFTMPPCGSQIMMTANEMKANEMKTNDTVEDERHNTMADANECVPPAPIRTPKHAAKRVAW